MEDNCVKYENKCNKCNTWSVDNNGGAYESYGYGVEKWCITYFCVNCNEECCVEEGDDWNNIAVGETIFF